MFIARVVHSLIGMIVACGLASAQNTCDSNAVAVDEIRQKIDRDKKAIKDLGFNIDTTEIDALANASADQRNKMAHTAYKNLVENLTGEVLKNIGESAGKALIPGAGLPNGYASLNPLNVNKFINRLDNPNGPVALLLKQLAATAQKAARLKYLQQLPAAVEREQGGYDLLFGEASTQARSLEAYRKLTKALAELGGYPQAARVLEIGTSGADVLVAYANLVYGNLSLKRLNDVVTAKAKALVTLDSTIKKDVNAFNVAMGQHDDCAAKKVEAGNGLTNNGTLNTCSAQEFSCKAACPDGQGYYQLMDNLRCRLRCSNAFHACRYGHP